METKYDVESIPMENIFSDAVFNCRGDIAPIDVINLAKDIEANGLDTPITVRPYTIDSKPNIKYKIVTGHRRHMAFRINQSTHIPAIVRTDLDELHAHLLNLRENLHRQDLNIKQEAHALQYFIEYRGEVGKMKDRPLFNDQEIAQMFGQSRGWVQVRKDLLSLPNDIQDEAAAGTLNQQQIKAVAKIKRVEDRYALVRKIKDAKIRGDKMKSTNETEEKDHSSALKAKRRDVSEIREMMLLMYNTIGPGLSTRFGAWTAGDISTVEFLTDLKKHCDTHNIEFEMPKYALDALLSVGKKEAVAA